MTRSALIPTLLAATVVAGCGASGDHTNKAGAPVEGKRQVITLQATDAGSDESEYLARQIEKRSGGTIEVRRAADYDSRIPANEVKLARALRAGDEDFAILPSRAWTKAGVPAFAALQAPFVLGTHDAARRAMAGPAGELLAGELRRVDVEPLALVPTQLRRLLATRALTAPERFAGTRLRIVDNDTTAAVIEGARGRTGPGAGIDRGAAARSGRAGSTAPRAPRPSSSTTATARAAKHLTGYALFDRVDTIVASPGASERLSAGQQKALHAAAADTARFAATQAAREDADIATLCAQGVRVDVPSAASLRALAAATAPVRAALVRDAMTAEVLEQLDATPGAGPQALAAPSECTGGRREAAPKVTAQPAFPEGTYVTTVTKADEHRFGEYGSNFQRTLTHHTRFRNGRVRYTVSPECGPQGGPLPVRGVLQGRRATNCSSTGSATTGRTRRPRWSYYDGKLTFTESDVGAGADKALYFAHPWRKVG